MNASATLWVIGLVCLIGAVVGQAFKIMGNELPALSSRVARVALAAVGALALALGTVTFLADGTGQKGAEAQPTDRRPATGTPTASPTTTTTVETAAPAVPPSIHWQGLTKITAAGVDFDTNPPSPAGGAGVYVKKDVNVFNLFGGQGVLFAESGRTSESPKRNVPICSSRRVPRRWPHWATSAKFMPASEPPWERWAGSW